MSLRRLLLVVCLSSLDGGADLLPNILVVLLWRGGRQALDLLRRLDFRSSYVDLDR